MTPSPSSGDPTDLSQNLVDELLAASSLPWRDVTVLAATGSTNVDLTQRLTAGSAEEGATVAAGEQVAGRGRQGRDWESPAGTSLSLSVALAPPVARSGFVPMLAALGVLRAIRGLCDVSVDLKWPNDVMIGDGKVAGILAEGTPRGIAVGCGINVAVPEADLPVPTATSLSDHGADVDRSRLLVTILEQIHAANELWRESGYSAAGSGLLDAYRSVCATIGAEVEVGLPDGTVLRGRAENVDDDGRLIVATESGRKVLTAGDVLHLRGTAVG